MKLLNFTVMKQKQIVLQRKKKAKIQPQEIVRIFALGGMDEDGKNMLCIEIDGDIYIVEAGIKFPDAKKCTWN